MTEATQGAAEPRLPRITIQFCTQCKWMLRAAYYAQELLSTFSVSLGEVSLQPATGGVFVVDITTSTPNQTNQTNQVTTTSTSPSPASRLPTYMSLSESSTAVEIAAANTVKASSNTTDEKINPNPQAGAAAAEEESPLQKTKTVRLWDRKTDGGFPETKELKRRVRDVIQPGRDLGHVDRDYSKGGGEGEGKGGEKEEGSGERAGMEVKEREGGGKVCSDEKCEDCD